MAREVNLKYKLISSNMYERIKELERENERNCMRVNFIKKLTKRTEKEIAMVKRRLDRHNDNWRSASMIPPNPKRKIEQKRGPKPKPKPEPDPNAPPKVKKERKKRTPKNLMQPPPPPPPKKVKTAKAPSVPRAMNMKPIPGPQAKKFMRNPALQQYGTTPLPMPLPTAQKFTPQYTPSQVRLPFPLHLT